jgi:uncharacterized protein
VNIVDANVLLYAVNTQSTHHEAARTWLDEALSGGAIVGFSWVALLAFLRLSTKANLFPEPLDPEGALRRVEHWLTSPAATIVEPTASHLRVMRDLLSATGVGGNLVNDVHLAALAIEHRGRVVTYDTDFRRFPNVRAVTPDQA